MRNTWQRFGRRVLTGIALAGIVPSTLLMAQNNLTPSEFFLAVQRGVTTLRVAAELARRYRNVDRADWPSLHDDAARLVYELCTRQGGLYVKAAQIVCTSRVGLPDAFVRELSQLVDHATPSSMDDVRFVLRESIAALGTRDASECAVDALFSFIDPIPLGVASLAQVHRARLRGESGTHDVAVKVQHRRLRYEIPGDLFTLRLVVRLIEKSIPSAHFTWLFHLVQEGIQQELNFNLEAENAAWCRSTLCPAHPFLHVPRIHLATRAMLVMELVPGINISHFFESAVEPSHAIAREEGAKGSFDSVAVPSITKEDRYHIAKTLMRVYADMIFLHGRVHCDPHPGNILYDPSTRNVYLLDHGLYRTLPEDFRRQHIQLWYSLFTLDDKKLRDVCTAMGIPQYAGLLSVLFTQREPGRYRRSDARSVRRHVEQTLIPHTRATTPPERAEETNARSPTTGAARGASDANHVTLHLTRISDALEELPDDLLIIMKVMLILRSQTNELGFRGIARQQYYASAANSALWHIQLAESRYLLAMWTSLKFQFWYLLFSFVFR